MELTHATDTEGPHSSQHATAGLDLSRLFFICTIHTQVAVVVVGHRASRTPPKAVAVLPQRAALARAKKVEALTTHAVALMAASAGCRMVMWCARADPEPPTPCHRPERSNPASPAPLRPARLAHPRRVRVPTGWR